MIGSTIRKLMTNASWPLSAHISTRMMKLTTGVLRIAVTSGVASASTTREVAARAAPRTPASAASRNPAEMRTKECPMVPQKPAVGMSSASRTSTPAGETSRISRWTTTVATCHTPTQNARTSAGRANRHVRLLVGALGEVVEVIARQASADRGRVGPEQHLQVPAQGGLELGAVDVGDVARGDCSLGDLGGGHDACLRDQRGSLGRFGVRELGRRLVVG